MTCNGCRYFARRHYGEIYKGLCEKHLKKIEDCRKEGCEDYAKDY